MDSSHPGHGCYSREHRIHPNTDLLYPQQVPWSQDFRQTYKYTDSQVDNHRGNYSHEVLDPYRDAGHRQNRHMRIQEEALDKDDGFLHR